jgi:hypothetical protein
MSFIRPEARAEIWRWREALAGLATAALGLWWIVGPGGLLGWLGLALCLAGAALCVVGYQRGRFRGGGGGPGMVQVDERQIIYFGPLNGGTIAVADLERLALDPTGSPAHWVLDQPGHSPLFIPVNAEGADALFDVFATLPGMRTERMLAELQGRAVHPVVIWERRSMRPAHQRLH